MACVFCGLYPFVVFRLSGKESLIVCSVAVLAPVRPVQPACPEPRRHAVALFVYLLR